MNNTIELIAESLGILPFEDSGEAPPVSLDEPMPRSGMGSRGYRTDPTAGNIVWYQGAPERPSASQSKTDCRGGDRGGRDECRAAPDHPEPTKQHDYFVHEPDIKLGDLTLCKDTSGAYTKVYSWTFNYNPYEKQSYRVIKETGNCTIDWNTEEVFWEQVTGKIKPTYKTYNSAMHSYNRKQQYEIFCKHFARWEKQINKTIPGVLNGYKVCIEYTKSDVIHAHGIFYSNNNYADMCSSTARVLWAQISKGKVCAMKDAFAEVKSEKHWLQYITKQNNNFR